MNDSDFNCESYDQDNTIDPYDSVACTMPKRINYLKKEISSLDNLGFNALYRFEVEILNFLYQLSEKRGAELCRLCKTKESSNCT